MTACIFRLGENVPAFDHCIICISRRPGFRAEGAVPHLRSALGWPVQEYADSGRSSKKWINEFRFDEQDPLSFFFACCFVGSIRMLLPEPCQCGIGFFLGEKPGFDAAEQTE